VTISVGILPYGAPACKAFLKEPEGAEEEHLLPRSHTESRAHVGATGPFDPFGWVECCYNTPTRSQQESMVDLLTHGGHNMPTPGKTHATQHIGATILVVMMEVDPAHEDDFNRWYNEEHLPERLEIPGYVSARRFKLAEGEGVLQYLCIWELEDGSPLHSEAYKAQQRRPSELRDHVHTYIKQRMRGLYTQIYPPVGAFEDHSGFHPERQ